MKLRICEVVAWQLHLFFDTHELACYNVNPSLTLDESKGTRLALSVVKGNPSNK
jgi:hypothetical protein